MLGRGRSYKVAKLPCRRRAICNRAFDFVGFYGLAVCGCVSRIVLCFGADQISRCIGAAPNRSTLQRCSSAAKRRAIEGYPKRRKRNQRELGADSTAVDCFAAHHRNAAGMLNRAAAALQFLVHNAKKESSGSSVNGRTLSARRITRVDSTGLRRSTYYFLPACQ
jgi:hypothetical protein